MSFVVGIDIGGTCTDCVVVDAEGHTTLAKAFSTPPDFSKGILDVLEEASRVIGLSASDLLRHTRLFLHSTTVAENAVVDGTLATAGVVTTQGFRDTLFATRGGFGRWSGLTDDEKRNPIETDKPVPLVPRRRIRAIPERTDHEGNVLAHVDPAEAEGVVRELLEEGVDALGVCLMWSFANPANEEVIKEVARKVDPDMFITISSEIAPIVGEYERTSTVALNASLGPVVERYLMNMVGSLKEWGFDGVMLVMQAYGGLLPLERAVDRPVGMLESGPVSGVMGSKLLGDQIGFPNIISADMGGTTFKVGTVRHGLIEYQRESIVLRYHYALPKRDVVSLGLAGGSIIWLEPRTNKPRVGPRGAGSYPGPICYDHGGTEPTLTDVDAILGYLNSAYFLGGRASLNIDAAFEAFDKAVAKPLDMDVEQAAASMHRLANSTIYDLLHKTTVQRGLDPRDFALFSTGGTAGMHLPAVADDLGVSEVVVPHSASVHGAFGLVRSDIVHEELVTRPKREPFESAEIEGIFKELSNRVTEQLVNEGFAPHDIEVARAIDMRYRRQVHIVTVPIEITVPIETAEPMNDRQIEETIDRFEALYKEKYGPESTFREAGIEMATFRVRATGRVRKAHLERHEPIGGDPSHALVEHRRAYVPNLREFEEVPAYDLDRMNAGTRFTGPGIIWTPVTTVVVNSGQGVLCDEFKNLVISTSPGGRGDA